MKDPTMFFIIIPHFHPPALSIRRHWQSAIDDKGNNQPLIYDYAVYKSIGKAEGVLKLVLRGAKGIQPANFYNRQTGQKVMFKGHYYSIYKVIFPKCMYKKVFINFVCDTLRDENLRKITSLNKAIKNEENLRY